MKSLDERVTEKLERAAETYYKSVKNAEKDAIRDHLIATLAERIENDMPGVRTTILGNLHVHLSESYNIEKDWALIMEKHEPLIRTIAKTNKAYRVVPYPEYNTYDYHFGNFTIVVDYSNGRCERVKVGEETETITKDIYEVKCY